MVALGLAVAFRKFSTDYVSAEDAAHTKKRGMWAGTFVMPAEVRAVKRHASAPLSRTSQSGLRQSATAGTCVIKGNRSRRGEWIYHLPGMPYYEQTRPEEIFCTEAQAQAAGYRRAIVR